MTQYDNDIQKVLKEFERSPKFTHDNTLKLTYDKATQAIQSLIHKACLESRLTELKLLREDYDISMDFEPIEKRIKELEGEL